jgi:hypothetical protein
LCEQRIDRPQLNPRAPTKIAQFCGVNVIPPVWYEQRQGRESLYEIVTPTRPVKSLEQLLQDQTGRHDRFTTAQRRSQNGHLAES